MVLPGILDHVTQRGNRRERTFSKMATMRFIWTCWLTLPSGTVWRSGPIA